MAIPSLRGMHVCSYSYFPAQESPHHAGLADAATANADGRTDLGTYILETIGTAAGLADLGVKDVEASVLDDIVTLDLTDAATFAPQRDIWITKNILVWSQDIGDTAALNEFEQRFSQIQAVPEPGMWALLGVAGLAACLTRRRAPDLVASAVGAPSGPKRV